MKQNLKVALAATLIAGGAGAYALTSGVSSLTPAPKPAATETAAVQPRVQTRAEGDEVAHPATKNATLLHTASACWGSNTGYNNVDAATAHYNTDAASGWAGVAFAEFALDVNAVSITKATLTWTTATGGRANTNRDNRLYYLPAGTTLGYDTIATAGNQYRFADVRTSLGNYPGQNTFVGTADVTEAVKALYEAGSSTIIFQWTGNAAGADLVGKGAEGEPALEIEFDLAPTKKLVVIEDFEAEEVAGWTANSAANCQILESAGNHYAAASQNGSGNRGAYYDAATEAIKAAFAEDATQWGIEWDLALQQGNVSARSQAAFGIGTTTSAYPANSIGLTELLFGLIGDQNTENAVSTTWYIVYPYQSEAVISDDIKLATVTLERGVFYHYALSYNAGTVTVEITNDGAQVAKVSYATNYSLADVRGFVATIGRGSGYAYLDNISVPTYVYAIIPEDPTFTLTGESYDPVQVELATATAGAQVYYTIDGGEQQLYTEPFEVTSTVNVAAWAELDGEVSNTITKQVVANFVPAPAITKVGQSYGADTVTIATDVPGAVLKYTLDDAEEAQTYTEPFVLDASATVAAWAEYKEIKSETATLAVTAGVVAEPVVTLTGVEGASRVIAFSTATKAANIVYSIDGGAEVVAEAGDATLIIDKTSQISVLARYTENEKVFESAKVDTAFEAGTEVKLAGVEIATDDYSAANSAADLKVSTSQLDVLLNPAVEIVWAYGQVTGVAANGDIIKGVPVGATFTAFARAQGYQDSDVAEQNVVASYASTIFAEDYEDGTVGSWKNQIAGAIVNTAREDGTHYLVHQISQSGNRWGSLTFPEFTSSDYTMSFKWAVAPGNGAENNLYIRTKAEDGTLVNYLTFKNASDMNTAKAPRITEVFDQNGAKVGEFGNVLNTRFELPATLATIELTVSANGTVLTVVNNEGSTQVKAKVSDEPIVVAQIYEDLGRSYGGWAFDDVKIAGRSGEVMAPEFTLDSYTVLNPTIAMASSTDKTQIYYRVAPTEYKVEDDGSLTATDYTFEGEFQLYEAPVVLTDPASIIEAYAVYDGVVESAKSISPVYLSLAQVEAPTVTFVSEAGGAKTFSVKDNNLSTVTAVLFYQPIGATEADTLKEANVTFQEAGWFKVYAQVGELQSTAVWRYVDARESYAEPYAAVNGAAETLLPAATADLEIGAGATVIDYPEAAPTVSGKILVHTAVTGPFNSYILPFAYKVGEEVITNAAGDTLTLGEDYEVVKYTNKAPAQTSNADITALTNEQNIYPVAEGTSVAAFANVMLHILNPALYGQDVISSGTAATFAIAQTTETEATNGWRLFANRQLLPYQLSYDAYVLSEDGTKLVWTAKPVLAPLSTAILVDAANQATLGAEIILDGPTVGLQSIETETEAGATYDLNGRKATTNAKGIVIIGGKKAVVK